MQLDLNSATAARKWSGLRVVEAIDAALLKKQARTEPRRYLGGSYIGDACERAIQWQYQLVERERDFPPHILRVFERGHRMEDMAADWLREAGFELKTEGRDGKQFGFEAAGGRFKGHADGVIVGWHGDGPAPASFPALWENKALNAKNWAKVVKQGVQKVKPTYHAQVMLYQYHLGLTDHPAVWTAINADTMEMHCELIPFDAAECQRLIDRAARIITATDTGETLPRGFTDPEGFGCKFCDFRQRCWAH